MSTETVVTYTAAHTADTPQLLLEHHLKALRLPTILREYDKIAGSAQLSNWTIDAICCASPNWSCWIASAEPLNAAYGKRSSRSLRPSTASFSPPFPR